jgi:hypothetical protein
LDEKIVGHCVYIDVILLWSSSLQVSRMRVLASTADSVFRSLSGVYFKISERATSIRNVDTETKLRGSYRRAETSIRAQLSELCSRIGIWYRNHYTASEFDFRIIFR